MDLIFNQKSFNKQNLKKILKEFIEESRKNIDIKINTINLVLQSMKEENEQHINKSMKNNNYLIKLFSIVVNFCEKNNINIGISRKTNSYNFTSGIIKKTERAQSTLGRSIAKNNKPFEILNNNKKYTMKYMGAKLKNKNQDNHIININNKSISPMNNFNEIYNKSSSFLNKVNIALKNKNKSNKKNINNNNAKLNINEKEKGNNDISEYKINNMSSSYNNNYTNIKTNKIVFIDLKNDNNNNLNNDLNNENKIKINENYLKNLVNNDIGNNNKIILKSSRNKVPNHKNMKVAKIYNNSHISTYNNNLKNQNINNKNLSDNNGDNKNNKNNKIDISNIKTNNKFSNLIIQKIDQKDNNINNYTIHFIKKGSIDITKSKILQQNEIQVLKKDKNLLIKECAYYILSKSPILRFCERMIFSRSTPNLRNILTKEIIFKENKTILENKIIELKEKIALCNKILETPFTASKTAEITLNFITSLKELEFKEFSISMADEEEKKYYLNYIKVLYYLLDEEIDNDEQSNKNEKEKILILRSKLYTIINNKGYNSIRDYLYNVFIKKKVDIKEIPKINEINELLSKINSKLEIQYSLKFSKFISFTMYLIKEIVKFGNNIKSTFELKIKAENVIDIIIQKLDKYNNKNNYI